MPRILIVDDSRFARLVTAAIVEQNHPDWEVVQAADGTEALELMREQEFDFATIDMNMPGHDGIEVKSIIDAEKPGLRAVLVTANIQDSVRERAAPLFLDFLEKPVDAARLLALLEEHVG
jgi:two-component system chemotaxis response regulator CheY